MTKKYIQILDKDNNDLFLKNSEVTVIPSLTSGVEIATITTSDGSKTLYAPTPTSADLTINGVASFPSVQSLKEATGFQAGDVVMTRGYYKAGDGGAAFYRVCTITSDVSSGWSSSQQKYYPWFLIPLLDENLYAMLIPFNDKVNIMQLGGMPVATIGNMASQTESWAKAQGANYWRDTHDNFLAYIYLCRYINRVIELNLPAGHFFTTPCHMVISADKGIRVKGAAGRQYGHDSCSMLHPWENGQDYIWTVSGSAHLLQEGYSYIGTAGVCMENVGFSGLTGGGQRTTDICDAKVCLVMSGLADSTFDNLLFKGTHGLPMLIDKTQETHFGKLMFQGCGAFMYGYAFGCIYIPNIANFVRKVWGVSSLFYGNKDSNGNYTDGYATCHRNCSALYFEYIEAEGIAGSIIHSETTEFCHSEIGNIQWEGTFSGYACRAGDINNSTRIGASYINSSSDDGYSQAGTSKALTAENPNPTVYTKEKTIYCGALTGFCYEIQVVSISQTWGTNSYIAGYEDTFYRVYQAGAIVYDYHVINNQYSIIHLDNYYSRSNYPLPVYVTVPNDDGSSEYTTFVLGMPVEYDTKWLKPNKGPAPIVNIAPHRLLNIPDRVYPGLITDSGYYRAFYDADSQAPAHIGAWGPNTPFFYRAGYHYFARVKLKSLRADVITNNTSNLTYQYLRCFTGAAGADNKVDCLDGKFRPAAYNDWFVTDITPDYTQVSDRITLYFQPGSYYAPNMIIDYIQAMPNICYQPSTPATSTTWLGRLWYDTANNVMKKCTQVHRNAIFKLTATYSSNLQAGTIVLNIEGTEVSLSITEANLANITSNETFAYYIMLKLRNSKYFAQMAYRPTSYSDAQTNVVYFNAKSYKNQTIQLVSNNVGGTIALEASTTCISSDTWSEI